MIEAGLGAADRPVGAGQAAGGRHRGEASTASPISLLGLGAVEALARPGTGRVVGAYGKAAYLRVPGGLFALTGDGVPCGPLHARTTAELGRLWVGDRVVVTPTLLEVGPLLLDLRFARTWRGPTPAGIHPSLGRPAPGAPPLDLHGLAARLGGRGPGLTPAGDDRLAGVLLVARFRWGVAAEPELVGIASAVPTNDIARAFLVWAARGQCIEPAHRYLATGSPQALADLTRIGHSSGTELVAGIRLGARSLAPVRVIGSVQRRCNDREQA